MVSVLVGGVLPGAELFDDDDGGGAEMVAVVVTVVTTDDDEVAAAAADVPASSDLLFFGSVSKPPSLGFQMGELGSGTAGWGTGMFFPGVADA